MSDINPTASLDYIVDAPREMEAFPSLDEQILDRSEPVNIAKLPDVYLDAETRQRIELWLGEQISNMKSERQTMEEIWQQIEYLYELTELPELEVTDFPFEDSAHLVIGIIAMYTETIWAKLHNTIHSPSDPFATKPRNKDYVPFYKALRSFITILCAPEELDLETATSTLFMELVMLGTCISKTVYVQEDALRWQYDNTTKKYNKVVTRITDCPKVIPVPNADFLFPISSKTLDDADIQAHRVALKYGEVKRRLRSGLFKLDKKDHDLAEKDLKAWVSTKRSPSESDQDNTMGVNPMDNDKLEFYEVWFEYALPGRDGDHYKNDDDDFEDSTSSGLPVKLTAWYNTDTGKLFRIQHNHYPLQLTPFDACSFIPRKHRVHGIGVGHMALPGQKEITAMHNQRLDNATINNANVTFIKDDSLLPLNFKVRPGGTYRVSDPNEIQIKPLGQKYDSTIQEEQHTLSLIERRIGAQDYNPEQKVGTSTQAIVNMQELTRKFDAVVRQVRAFLARIMRKVLLLTQQHYPEGKPLLIMGEDGQYVEQFLKLPADAIEYGIAISVTATTSSTSKELDRQAKLSLFNLVTQYYGQLTQYVIQASNAQMPPPVQQAMLQIIEGLGELVRDILEDFDIPEREQLTIKLSELGLGIQQPGLPGAPGAGNGGQVAQAQSAPPPGGPNGTQGNVQVPTMGDIQRMVMQSAGAG